MLYTFKITSQTASLYTLTLGPSQGSMPLASGLAAGRAMSCLRRSWNKCFLISCRRHHWALPDRSAFRQVLLRRCHDHSRRLQSAGRSSVHHFPRCCDHPTQAALASCYHTKGSACVQSLSATYRSPIWAPKTAQAADRCWVVS